MAYYYIKLYHEILDDPKMGRLSDHLYRRVIELFLMAGSYVRDGEINTGYLPTTDAIAWKLRCDESTILDDLEAIEKVGIIQNTETGWLVVNFSRRQDAVTTTERTHQFKKRAQEKTLERKQGIYKISSPNGKQYIGASVDIERRVKDHFREGASQSDHWMHNDIIQYGRDSFVVTVLELVSNQADLPDRETYWMNQYGEEERYNNENTGKVHRDWERNKNDNGTNRSIELKLNIESDIDIESDRKQPAAAAAAAVEFGEVVRTYEQNIGALTPLISDMLKNWYATYGNFLTCDAIQEAVKNNVRKPAYIDAILKNWGSNGRGSRAGTGAKPDYTGGAFSEFVQH